MAEYVYSGVEALGLYLSGNPGAEASYGAEASLGGARLAAEVMPLRFLAENAIPQVAVQFVSGACGVGAGYLRVSAAGKLRFAAPGEAEGAEVSIAAGETAVVASTSAGKYVRVTRVGTDDLTQPVALGMKLTLVRALGDVVGHANVASADAAAGVTTYSKVFLHNRSAYPATSIVVTGTGLSVGVETPAADGTVPVLANDRTAPAGVTFGATAAVSSLAPFSSVVICIRRTVAVGAAASTQTDVGIAVEWTANEAAQASSALGAFAVANDALAVYELYLGQDGTAPNFGAAPAATSATLPFTKALAAPPSGTRTYRAVVRRRSAHGLQTENLLERTVTIDSAGAEVSSAVSAPSSVTLTPAPGGYVYLDAMYMGSQDEEPGDTWQIYVRTNGTDPNPALDTPTEVDVSAASEGQYGTGGMWGASTKHLRRNLGPYEWGTDVRVLVRMKRSSDSATSANTAAVACVVSTIPPAMVHHRQVLLGFANGVAQPAHARNTTVYSEAFGVKVARMPGEWQFWIGAECVLRALWGGDGDAVIEAAPGWSLYVDTTAWGAGTGNVEVVAGPVVYLNVAGVRRLKLDPSTKRISAAAFDIWNALTDCPSATVVLARSAEALLQVWDPGGGRYVSLASVASDGTFKTAAPVRLGA